MNKEDFEFKEIIIDKIKNSAIKYPRVNRLYTTQEGADNYGLIERVNPENKENFFIYSYRKPLERCTIYRIKAFEDKEKEIIKPPYRAIYPRSREKIWYELDFGIGMGLNSGADIEIAGTKIRIDQENAREILNLLRI